MKRFVAYPLVCAVALVFFAGCGEETKSKTTDTKVTPGGKSTTTEEHKVETSGKNPPKAP
jgi:hypothetical protein